jgi:hypothetical protein
MKNRVSGYKAILLLGGVLSLCCMSFVGGRHSAAAVMPASHATHQMNELDRLQLETAHQQ